MRSRNLVVIRRKQPFADWVKEADSCSDGTRITLKEVYEGQPTLLIHDYGSEDLEGWLALYYSGGQ